VLRLAVLRCMRARCLGRLSASVWLEERLHRRPLPEAAAAARAGVTQRVVRHAALALDPRGGGGAAAGYAHARLPLFQPLPESQPVLPCLLRRLLQQARAGALRGAARGALPAARPVWHRVC